MNKTIVGRIGKTFIHETKNYQSRIPEQEFTGMKNIRMEFARCGQNPDDIVFELYS